MNMGENTNSNCSHQPGPHTEVFRVAPLEADILEDVSRRFGDVVFHNGG